LSLLQVKKIPLYKLFCGKPKPLKCQGTPAVELQQRIFAEKIAALNPNQLSYICNF